MSRRSFAVVATVLGVVVLASCRKGGRSCYEGLSIAPTTRLSALSAAEKAQICDRGVCNDGYGASTTCANGVAVSSYPNQAACLKALHWSKCGDLTVGDHVACATKINANPCDSLRIFAHDPVCARQKECMYPTRED